MTLVSLDFVFSAGESLCLFSCLSWISRITLSGVVTLKIGFKSFTIPLMHTVALIPPQSQTPQVDMLNVLAILLPLDEAHDVRWGGDCQPYYRSDPIAFRDSARAQILSKFAMARRLILCDAYDYPA